MYLNTAKVKISQSQTFFPVDMLTCLEEHSLVVKYNSSLKSTPLWKRVWNAQIRNKKFKHVSISRYTFSIGKYAQQITAFERNQT